MAELVDAPDLGSGIERCGSSSLLTRTNIFNLRSKIETVSKGYAFRSQLSITKPDEVLLALRGSFGWQANQFISKIINSAASKAVTP